MISTESATVYRGGGRRWLTRRAACRAEARAKIKTKCDCDYCDHPEMPGCPTEDLPCQYHDGSPRAEKVLRRLTRMYMAASRATPSSQKGTAQAKTKPLGNRCAANRDGECVHIECPQLRDDEPRSSGRHCPLDQKGTADE